MLHIVTRVLEGLPDPDPALLATAREAAGECERTAGRVDAADEARAAAHARLASRVEALHAVEQRAPVQPHPWPGRITVTAFNAERLKRPDAARALLDSVEATAVLLGEVDVGMARSGNRHGLRALTEQTGEGYVYGVEFVELGLGDAQEMRDHAGERNASGFHGNGVVSALRLADSCLIRLDEGGRWFGGHDGAQHRVGGRIAVAARVADSPQPLWLVSVHLESKTDPEDRDAQVGRLLAALDRITAGAAAIIAGDFNTKALPPGEEAGWLGEPERWEPLFARMRSSRFEWRAENLAAATQRTGPSGDPSPPFRKLDWFFTRGVTPSDPRVIPALDGDGRPISDHEMLALDVRLRDPGS